MNRIKDTRAVSAVEEQLRVLFLDGLGGKSGAYHAFLDKLSGHLRAYLRKRISHLQDEVEDIVQEILLAVHNGRHIYRADQPLTAWVYAIARYKLTDCLRGRSRGEALNDPLDDDLQIFASSDLEPAEAKHDIGKLLKQLPDRQRLPILHIKLQGMSVAETARLTGLSESAVKVGVHRGVKALVALIGGAV